MKKLFIILLVLFASFIYADDFERSLVSGIYTVNLYQEEYNTVQVIDSENKLVFFLHHPIMEGSQNQAINNYNAIVTEIIFGYFDKVKLELAEIALDIIQIEIDGALYTSFSIYFE